MVRKSKKKNEENLFHNIELHEDISPEDLYAEVFDQEREYKNNTKNTSDVKMEYLQYLQLFWEDIVDHQVLKKKHGNVSSDKIYSKEEYKNNMKMMRGMINDPEINHIFTFTEQKMFKKPWQRLVDFLDFKHTNYIFYPITTDSEFNQKIYKKKEFQINKQAEINVDEFEDIQEELCPNKNKNFNLQSHQKLIKSYLSHNTYYNGLLIFHGTGTGKTCSSITIAESYKTLVAENSKKVLVILSKSVKSNFIHEIHDVARGYNQCTGSDYLNYEFLNFEILKF